MLAALSNALRVVGKDLSRRPRRHVRRRCCRHGDPAAAAGRRRHATSWWPTSRASCTQDRDGPRRVAALDRREHQPRGADRHADRGAVRRRRLHRRLRAEPARRRRRRRDGRRRIVFALANPVPEVDPAVARQHAAVVATGRSDYPNQINNVLVFPGVFRGLLDAHAALSTPRCCSPRRRRSPTSSPRRAERELHHPERLPGEGAPSGGYGRTRCRRGRARHGPPGPPGPARGRAMTPSRPGA